MARRHPTALAALAALTLGACSDAAAPSPATSVAPATLTRASAAARAAPVLASAHSNATEPAGVDRGRFNVSFRFLTPVTNVQRATFAEAGTRWERIIIADVPSISGTLPAGFCGLPGVPAFTGTIDDVLIDVILVEIDGPGNIAGAAGPCAARLSDNLTAYGIMFFDTADLEVMDQFEIFDEVIVHEMGHVLGFGVLWNYGNSLVTPSYDFVGKYANIHYNSVGGEGFVPVENQYGPGTRGAHWRESVLGNELMTGFIGLGESPLSRVTAASLRDLGYGTSLTAEPWKLPVAEEEGTSVDSESAALVGGFDIGSAEVLFGVKGVVAPK